MTTPTPPESAAPPTPVKAPPARRALRIVLFSVIGLIVVLFIGIQFIPVNRTTPPVTTPIKWDSPQTEQLARRACMDCHNNETVWPWYSYVAPVSWEIYYDVVRGRQQLNFSTLGTAGQREGGFGAQGSDLAFQLGAIMAGSGRFGGEFRGEGERRPEGGFVPRPGGEGGGEGGRYAEQILNGTMPPARYTQFRPDAVLTAAEQQQLIAGLQATFGGGGGEGN